MLLWAGGRSYIFEFDGWSTSFCPLLGCAVEQWGELVFSGFEAM